MRLRDKGDLGTHISISRCPFTTVGEWDGTVPEHSGSAVSVVQLLEWCLVWLYHLFPSALAHLGGGRSQGSTTRHTAPTTSFHSLQAHSWVLFVAAFLPWSNPNVVY